MTFYVIFVLKPGRIGWDGITDPMHYLDAKKKMQELKKQNKDCKYKLVKTSY